MKNLQLSKLLMSLTLILSLITVPVLAQEEEVGDLWLLDVESVSPSNVNTYIEWGKEFKAVADETKFQNFYVESVNNEFSYAWNIGKSFSGLEEFEKDFTEWVSANPKVGEMYTKYAHTLINRTRYLWRHLPKYSYNIEGYDDSENTYARQYRAWIKEGKWSEAYEVLEEYRNFFKDANISVPFNVYRNVFGTDQNCIAFRQTFKDPADWSASINEVQEKIDSEKMQALFQRWSAVILKSEDLESWLNSELTHVNPE